MSVTAVTPITGDNPDRNTQLRSVFSANMAARQAAMKILSTELGVSIPELNIDIAIAVAAAVTAAAASASALAANDTEEWVSAGPFVEGDIRFSPTNFLNYRCIVDNTATTDPITDDTNWAIYNDSVSAQAADASPADASTHTFDWAVAQFQHIQCPAAGTITLAFDNMPTGVLSAFVFQVEDGGDCVVNFPAGTKHPDGIDLIFTEAGIDMCAAWKDKDGDLVVGIGMYDIGVPA